MASKSINGDSKATKRQRITEIIKDIPGSTKESSSMISRASCEIDLRSARKQWPLLNLSLKSGLLVVTSLSTTDVLAEAANEYTATFAAKNAPLLQCLVNSVFEAKHRDSTVKYLKSVLEAEEAGLIAYLIISTLLAFTKVSLEDTVAELLRRLTGAKPEAIMLVPVNDKYRVQALKIFKQSPSTIPTQTPDETVLFHLLSDLIKSQEHKVKSQLRLLRQANVMAETHVSVAC